MSAPAVVTVNAPKLNQAPTATDQSVSVTVGTTTVVDLHAADPDGPPPTIVEANFSDPNEVVTDRSGLSLSVLATTPGTFEVKYQVTDGEANSPIATVTIVASAPTTTTTTPPRPRPRRRSCRRPRRCDGDVQRTLAGDGQPVTGDRVAVRSDRRLNRQRHRCQRVRSAVSPCSTASRHDAAS